MRAIVIGASAGGVQALLRILSALKAQFACPIMIVLHVPPRNNSSLVELLRDRCAITVKEAEDKEVVQRGTAYFAPSGYHLLLEKDLTIALSSEEPVNYSRPAIDVLFETAADAFGGDVTAIVLTGANHDGAQGLRAIAASGGETIVQDPTTAEMPTMPLAALEACPGSLSLSIDEIVAHLQQMGA